jgi:hypothetical protein
MVYSYLHMASSKMTSSFRPVRKMSIMKLVCACVCMFMCVCVKVSKPWRNGKVAALWRRGYTLKSWKQFVHLQGCGNINPLRSQCVSVVHVLQYWVFGVYTMSCSFSVSCLSFIACKVSPCLNCYLFSLFCCSGVTEVVGYHCYFVLQICLTEVL